MQLIASRWELTEGADKAIMDFMSEPLVMTIVLVLIGLWAGTIIADYILENFYDN